MAADARKPTESGEEKAAQIRVLIAEDNMINMKVALGILRRMGYAQVCPSPTIQHCKSEGGNAIGCRAALIMQDSACLWACEGAAVAIFQGRSRDW